MESQVLKVRLDAETVVQLLKHKPKSLPTSTFCALLVEQGLDRWSQKANNQEQPAQRSDSDATAASEKLHPPVSLVGEATQRQEKKAFEVAELHPELETVRDTFVRFGKVKKGDRGQHGAKLAATGLRKIGEKYGWQVAHDQLDLAVNNRWAGISLSNYEKFLPKAAAKEPEHRHPASQVFTAKDFDNGPTTNPALEGLF